MCSVDECSHLVNAILTKNPHLSALLVNPSTGRNVPIACRKCSDKGAEGKCRAFLQREPLEIVLCTNKLRASHIEEVVAHESTHAYDLTHRRVDLDTGLGLAYSEVRAARNAECSGWYPFESLLGMKERCIRKIATLSTAVVFPHDDAAKCVEVVFDKAMEDHSPK